MKRIAYSKAALKTLGRILPKSAALIRAKIHQYAAEPSAQANNVKALKGEAGVYRLRVGDWRILFSEDGQIIAIVKVSSRGGAYD
jgi:mRNA interferase RelE/StbE